MTVHAARIRRVLRHLNVEDLGNYWSVVLDVQSKSLEVFVGDHFFKTDMLKTQRRFTFPSFNEEAIPKYSNICS
jgi:hypothetical protein